MKSRLSIFRFLILAFGTISLLFVRMLIMDFVTPTFQVVDNPASFEQNIYLRLLNYNYIYALNFWLLIYPSWLCFDWSMGCIPLIRNLCDFRILSILVFWLSILAIINTSLFHCGTAIRRYFLLKKFH